LNFIIFSEFKGYEHLFFGLIISKCTDFTAENTKPQSDKPAESIKSAESAEPSYCAYLHWAPGCIDVDLFDKMDRVVPEMNAKLKSKTHLENKF
jgi:hypothetical protein